MHSATAVTGGIELLSEQTSTVAAVVAAYQAESTALVRFATALVGPSSAEDVVSDAVIAVLDRAERGKVADPADGSLVHQAYDQDETELRITRIAPDGTPGATPVARVWDERSILDAAVRADGMLVVVVADVDRVGAFDLHPAAAEVIDPATGELVAEFALPDGTRSIDYDASGTWLLVSGDSGDVRYLGAGQDVFVGSGMYAAAWN